MVRASAVGAIDFTACDHSRRWWQGARMKMRAVEDDLRLRVAELFAERAIAVQPMVDVQLDAEARQQYAIDAIMEFQAEAMPWFAVAKPQNDLSADQKLDQVAQWYLAYGVKRV